MNQLTTTKQMPPEEIPNSWPEVLEKIQAEIPDDLPQNVVRAVELLLAGYSTKDAAKEIGVSGTTVRGWITTYPVIAAALAKGRKLLSSWRMTELEKMFLRAVEVSTQVLNVAPDGRYVGTDEETGLPEIRTANSKILTVIAAQSRYIIGLFAAQQHDINVHKDGESVVLVAAPNALDYLAEKIKDMQTVEATYRVIDENPVVPPYKADGSPHYGELGILDTNDSGTLCHVCGTRVHDFYQHIEQHELSASGYEDTYFLEPGSVSDTKKWQK